MTKTKILHKLQQQLARQCRLSFIYQQHGQIEKVEAVDKRIWAIFWSGLDLLGDSWEAKLDDALYQARLDARTFHKRLNSTN